MVRGSNVTGMSSNDATTGVTPADIPGNGAAVDESADDGAAIAADGDDASLVDPSNHEHEPLDLDAIERELAEIEAALERSDEPSDQASDEFSNDHDVVVAGDPIEDSTDTTDTTDTTDPADPTDTEPI
jgi:hypothetical protein